MQAAGPGAGRRRLRRPRHGLVVHRRRAPPEALADAVEAAAPAHARRLAVGLPRRGAGAVASSPPPLAGEAGWGPVGTVSCFGSRRAPSRFAALATSPAKRGR